MSAAAANGHLEVVQWLLHQGGAQEDLRNENDGTPPPPPGTWLCTEGIIIHVVQWRIMKGALSLSPDGDAVLDDTTSQESGRNEKQQTNEGTDHHDHHW